MEVKAITKYVRVAPRKVRLVAELVTGKQVDTAAGILKFTNKKSAGILAKTLKSATANAENNNNMDGDSLFIKEITVNEGPTLKRFRPRAMGRASRIRKRTSHITVTLVEKKKNKKIEKATVEAK